MAAAYRVVTANRDDISSVTVVCDECETAVSLKIETAQVPPVCTSCGKQWSENVLKALAALGRFHREAKAAEANLGKLIFRFDIRQSE
jgi:hypothetical protein